ncbi:hypothetical protein K440DRAFT_282170 [Wilcoxina mikolae CBS 423.85]|nr:hypothetical protein K440DRAFT_282170 [Wilcoxina mikolae CBS 423.85]
MWCQFTVSIATPYSCLEYLRNDASALSIRFAASSMCSPRFWSMPSTPVLTDRICARGICGLMWLGLVGMLRTQGGREVKLTPQAGNLQYRLSLFGLFFRDRDFENEIDGDGDDLNLRLVSSRVYQYPRQALASDCCGWGMKVPMGGSPRTGWPLNRCIRTRKCCKN